MSTATAPAPQNSQTINVEEAAKQLAETDPRAALELVIAETQRMKAQAEYQRRDQELMATVTFGANGLEASSLAGLWRLANMYARADFVPDQYKRKPENCLIALQLASRMRIDPFMLMQNSYLVHGRPGIEAKLAIAMLNSSGKIKGRLRYEPEGTGDSRKCTAIAIDKETGEEIRVPVDWEMVKAEGWHLPKGKTNQPSKWMTIPDQMFRYRSAIFLIRAHYPEVLMGMQTADELDDIERQPVSGGLPTEADDGRSPSDRLADRIQGTGAGQSVPFAEAVADYTNGMNGNGDDAEHAEEDTAEETAETAGETEAPTETAPPDTGAPSPADLFLERIENAQDAAALAQIDKDLALAAQRGPKGGGISAVERKELQAKSKARAL